MNKGQKLWKEAIQVIPGGNGLLSKRPDRYAPKVWPVYFDHAKGVEIWDLDGNRYIDMAHMAVGTAVLGHSGYDVDFVVKNCIDKGLIIPEVLLTKKLIELNPFSGGV